MVIEPCINSLIDLEVNTGENFPDKSEPPDSARVPSFNLDTLVTFDFATNLVATVEDPTSEMTKNRTYCTETQKKMPKTGWHILKRSLK